MNNLSNLAYARRALALTSAASALVLGAAFLAFGFFQGGDHHVVDLQRGTFLGSVFFNWTITTAIDRWMAIRTPFWPLIMGLTALALMPLERRYEDAVPDAQRMTRPMMDACQLAAERETPTLLHVLVPGFLAVGIGTWLNFGHVGYEFDRLGYASLSGEPWVLWGFVAAAVAYALGYAFGPSSITDNDMKYRYAVLRSITARTSMASASFGAMMAALVGYQGWTSLFVGLGVLGFAALGVAWNLYWLLHGLVFPKRESLSEAQARVVRESVP